MNKFRFTIKVLAIAIFTFAFASMAQAQASRTWVSGVGDDANPCSRTAPCKTFAGAISKTAACGEIDALDPGGFGAVTITKAITIDGTGTFASILASLTTGVIINAPGANDVITLRGLSINGFCNGVNGINILQAKTVNVEDCVIFRFNTGNGITSSDANGVNLNVRNSVIRDTRLMESIRRPLPQASLVWFWTMCDCLGTQMAFMQERARESAPATASFHPTPPTAFS